MENNSPRSNIFNLPSLYPKTLDMQTRHLLQSLFVVAICAAALAGSYHYSKVLHKRYLATDVKDDNSTRTQQGTAAQAEEKAETVGHIFWESVTRLIVSAKK